MTEIGGFVRQKRKAHIGALGEALFGVFALFCLLLILKNSEIAIAYITRGLLLCAETVIPSLFPFMVLSELIVSGGLVARLPRICFAPLRKLLRLPDAGCCAVLLGLVCGFPVGAKCAVNSYLSGELDRDQAERVLLCASPPSSAFLISAVGTSLWGNRRFGTVLYICVLAVTLLTGVLFARLPYRKRSVRANGRTATVSPGQPLRGAGLFTDAVRSSTSAMLSVCAYVVFFSAIMGALQSVLGAYHVPVTVSAALSGLLELSGGVSLAAGVKDRFVGACLCAFAAGWSGLSVHCQMLAVCDGSGLSPRRYLLAKALQGILTPLAFAAILSLFPSLLFTDSVF